MKKKQRKFERKIRENIQGGYHSSWNGFRGKNWGNSIWKNGSGGMSDKQKLLQCFSHMDSGHRFYFIRNHKF